MGPPVYFYLVLLVLWLILTIIIKAVRMLPVFGTILSTHRKLCDLTQWFNCHFVSTHLYIVEPLGICKYYVDCLDEMS